MTYGADYAAVYDAHWAFWGGAEVWPILRDRTQELRPDAKTWLDLGCGTGRFAAELVREGYQVTGVDASEAQLDLARRNVPAADFLHADLRTMQLPRTFDVISSTGGTLNYLLTLRDLERGLRAAKRHLAEGGLLVLDLNTELGMERTGGQGMGRQDKTHGLIVETRYDYHRGLLTWQITGFLREAGSDRYRRFQEQHTQRGYAPATFQGLLEKLKLTWQAIDADTLDEVDGETDRAVYFAWAA